MKLNEKQNRFARDLSGIHLVHAGPGTGKTETVKERYLEIIKKKKALPSDILLVTFTNNAADVMKKRIIDALSEESLSAESALLSEIVNAPISTFHSFCSDLIRNYGFSVPAYLGMTEIITDSFTVMENSTVEKIYFERFISRFMKDHPQYTDFFVPYGAGDDVFNLIRKLACKGIFPLKKNGRRNWFGDGRKYLNGDHDVFKKKLLKAYGRKGSSRPVKKITGKYQESCYFDDLDLFSLVQGETLNEKMVHAAFFEPRNALFEFFHALYWDYMRYLLRMNAMNFDFMVLFAYVLLLNNHSLRKDFQFDFIMIDEFQDTNEMQFKMAMLLSRSGNISAIGDWKQGIYSFRYATIDNILRFRERIELYKNELNGDFERIEYSTRNVTEHIFDINYRSTQKIIDFFQKTLTFPATGQDVFEYPDYSEKPVPFDDSKQTEVFRLRAGTREEEMKSILDKIREITGSGSYLVTEYIEGKKKERPIEFKDIAVLSRTREFAMKLQVFAAHFAPDISLSFEGGAEIFRSLPSIMVLAWLRLMTGRDREKALSVILEKEGLDFQDVRNIIRADGESVPENILEFKKLLLRKTDIHDLLSTIFSRYFDRYRIFVSPLADALLHDLICVFEKAPFDLEGMIDYMESNIDSRLTVEIENRGRMHTVTLQTIHSAKGLEYPVVFIADVNTRNFPSHERSSSVYDYDDVLGLRARKECREKKGLWFVFDRWQTDLLKIALTGEYDEERRLYYVAASRASQFLYITAFRPSSFFDPLDISGLPEVILYKKDKNIMPLKEKKKEADPVFHADVFQEAAPRMIPVHRVMKLKDPSSGGRGKEFGTKLHEFAARSAGGVDMVHANKDEKNVFHFIKSLNGEKMAEIDCYVPFEWKGEKCVFHGVIDLLVLSERGVDVIDFKTDTGKNNHEEYEKQVSVYCHAVKSVYPQKDVRGYIYYTHDDEKVEVMVRPLKEIVYFDEEDFSF